MSNLNIVFAGTPDFAAGHLQALIDAGFNVIAAYSQPDRKSGRGKKLQAPPVKQVAEAHGIPVFQPLNFKHQEDIDTLANLKPDLMVVVAYGLLLPKAVLDIPAHGCINVHGSILPRWRGAAPVERAIEAGDTETGITIMQMDEGLDTGDMLLKTHLPITSETTGDSLREALLAQGQEALVEVIKHIEAGTLSPEKQDDTQANYAHKLSKAEAEIDWSQSATQINQKIRAFNSSNACYTLYKGERIKLWACEVAESPSNEAPGTITAIHKKGMTVACGENSLKLTELQLPNAKRMPFHAILNGRADYFIEGNQFEQTAE